MQFLKLYRPTMISPLPLEDLPVPVALGDTCTRDVRLDREEIARFALATGDTNPLHHNQLAAQRARHGEIIASGQQITSMMIGLASTHFSRPGEGFHRELLCLNFNFAFKAPVFADQALVLSWHVASVQWHQRLGGWLAQADGRAGVRTARPSVVGRGTLLVRAIAP